MKLTIVPISFKEAQQFVKLHHRHHKPPIGHKFSIAVADENGTVHGVAMVGRPVARGLDDGWTLEVNRVATNGTPNSCSKLYGAAWRAAKALGYRKLVTYTLPEEGGASLRGAGWKLIGERGGGKWDCKSRPRIDTHPTQTKLFWEAPKYIPGSTPKGEKFSVVYPPPPADPSDPTTPPGSKPLPTPREPPTES